MLAVCTRVRIDGGQGAQDLPLDAAMLGRVQQVTRELSRDGLRVVAVAVKELPPAQTAYSVADETGSDADRLHRLSRPAEGIRRAGAEGAGRAWHRRQGAHRRQRSGHGPRLRARSACPRTRCCWAPQVEGMNDAGAGAGRRARIGSSPSSRRCTRSASCARCAPAATWSASWATASTTRRRCARPTSASRWTRRWTSPRRRPTSSCSRRA